MTAAMARNLREIVTTSRLQMGPDVKHKVGMVGWRGAAEKRVVPCNDSNVY